MAMRFFVDWALGRQRRGRRYAVQMATASTSVRRVEQCYVEPVGRLGAARATGDFQHVAVIAAAQVFPTRRHRP